jgi:membrane-associated protease RseP (regulator of RpoE activity)
MFATSLNLLPGGQLDGGHIVFALNPGAHKRVSRLAIAVLVPLGIVCWFGWFVWALLLWLSGLRHPAVPMWPELSKQRRAMSLLALLLLVLTLVPAPFGNASGRDVATDFKALIHLRLHR